MFTVIKKMDISFRKSLNKSMTQVSGKRRRKKKKKPPNYSSSVPAKGKKMTKIMHHSVSFFSVYAHFL